MKYVSDSVIRRTRQFDGTLRGRSLRVTGRANSDIASPDRVRQERRFGDTLYGVRTTGIGPVLGRLARYGTRRSNHGCVRERRLRRSTLTRQRSSGFLWSEVALGSYSLREGSNYVLQAAQQVVVGDDIHDVRVRSTHELEVKPLVLR
jgi:hypothetical protein